MGSQHPGGFNAADDVDGSVRFLRDTVGDPTIRSLITRDGNEVVPAF